MILLTSTWNVGVQTKNGDNSMVTQTVQKVKQDRERLEEIIERVDGYPGKGYNTFVGNCPVCTVTLDNGRIAGGLPGTLRIHYNDDGTLTKIECTCGCEQDEIMEEINNPPQPTLSLTKRDVEVIETIDVIDSTALRLSDAKVGKVEWLWTHRLAKGKVNIFDGDPGLGKSMVTTNVASRVSTGRKLPECEEGIQGGLDCTHSTRP